MYFDLQLELAFQQLMRPPVHRECAKPPVAAPTHVTYASLANETIHMMEEMHCRELVLPSEFAFKRSLNGKFQLTTRAWRIGAPKYSGKPSIGELRLVYIRGTRNEILNCWLFPNDPTTTPVFAAELVGVGNETKIAFIDIQVPALREELLIDVDLLTKPISMRYSALPSDEAPPSWAVDASQGNFTYARHADQQWTSMLRDCYVDYLQTYLRGFANQSTGLSLASELDHGNEVLHHYQLHHMENSPGKKFLGSLFGAEWTNQFMTDYLFTLPQG